MDGSQQTHDSTGNGFQPFHASLGSAEAALWQEMQLKADMFDYLCWLDGMEGPEELHGVDRLVIASDGTECWGKTYAEAVRIAMEHDKEIHDLMEQNVERMDGTYGVCFGGAASRRSMPRFVSHFLFA